MTLFAEVVDEMALPCWSDVDRVGRGCGFGCCGRGEALRARGRKDSADETVDETAVPVAPWVVDGGSGAGVEAAPPLCCAALVAAVELGNIFPRQNFKTYQMPGRGCPAMAVRLLVGGTALPEDDGWVDGQQVRGRV